MLLCNWLSEFWFFLWTINSKLPENCYEKIVVIFVDLLGIGEMLYSRLFFFNSDLCPSLFQTDYMSTLEKDFDYKEEHFDFIQQSIRKFCLQYGAALFYTSVKEDKNCDLLYKYLVHKIYNFPFRTPALVVEKDAVFM